MSSPERATLSAEVDHFYPEDWAAGVSYVTQRLALAGIYAVAAERSHAAVMRYENRKPAIST